MKYKEFFKEYTGDTFSAPQPDFDTYSEGEDTYSEEEVKQLYDKMASKFNFDEFAMGMEIEQEHNDITLGDPVMTAKIVLAHLREVPNYYTLIRKYVEPKEMKEDGAPTGGIGLNLAGGYINGASKPKDVKKTRKELDKEK